MGGPAKTCDVTDKIGHILTRGYRGNAEPLDLRFIMPTVNAGTVLEPFGTKFVLGAARAMAAIIIGEAVVNMNRNIADFTPEERIILGTLCYIPCTYEPCTLQGGVPELVTRSVMAKLSGDSQQVHM